MVLKPCGAKVSAKHLLKLQRRLQRKGGAPGLTEGCRVSLRRVADGLREAVYSVGGGQAQHLTLAQAARHLLRNARGAAASAPGEGPQRFAAAANLDHVAAGGTTRKRKSKRTDGVDCSDGNARDGGGGGGSGGGGGDGAAATLDSPRQQEDVEQPPRKRCKAALIEALAAVGMGVPRFKRVGRNTRGQLRVECRLGEQCLAVGNGEDFKAARMAARLQVASPPVPCPSLQALPCRVPRAAFGQHAWRPHAGQPHIVGQHHTLTPSPASRHRRSSIWSKRRSRAGMTRRPRTGRAPRWQLALRGAEAVASWTSQARGGAWWRRRRLRRRWRWSRWR